MRIELESGTPATVVVSDEAATRGLVIIPDIFGLRPLFDDLAARLSEQQHWAVGVFDPFAGHDLGSVDDRFQAVRGLDDERILADAGSVADTLTERAACSRVAVMGFCMGGMYAYKAASTRRFDAAVAFYGMIRVPVPWRGPTQGEPLAALAAGACPTLAIVGGLDPYTPPDDVASLSALAAVTVVAYPDAEHGFVHDPERPSHRPGDAADAWQRAVAFLA